MVEAERTGQRAEIPVLKSAAWTVGGGRALACAPFLVMGIVNATPDSFSDGGLHQGASAAVSHALRLLDEGAAVIDVGGESTRPYASPVTDEQEADRVLPVIRGLLAARPDTVVSVDTYRARTAARAIEAGVAIVNDISACADPELLEVVAREKPGYVLMHSQGRPADMQQAPAYRDVVGEILAFLEAGLARLVGAGLPEDRVVVDPGVGFGKTLAHNLTILKNLDRFASLGRPVLVGLSRKSFLGDLLGLSVGDRTVHTQVATALAARAGATIHRVHDVDLTVKTLVLADALR